MPSRPSGTPTRMTASNETGIDVAKTRNGDGPRYAVRARARRSMPCDPAPAMSPPARTATTIDPRPTSVASQPTTNRPGALRPSMVKVPLPGGPEGGSPTLGGVAGGSGADDPRSGGTSTGADGSSGEDDVPSGGIN